MVACWSQLTFATNGLLERSICLLAVETTPAPRLPEPVRQMALMALLAIALLGMLMIVVTLLGGHWVRRWGDRLRRPPVPPDVTMPKPGESQAAPLPREDFGSGDTVGNDETLS